MESGFGLDISIYNRKDQFAFMIAQVKEAGDSFVRMDRKKDTDEFHTHGEGKSH